MKELVCENCGSIRFHKEGTTQVCDFCGTKYLPTAEDLYVIDSTISLSEDVIALLKQWEKDPINGKKYAQMILQIDSSNKKAREELAKYNKNNSGGCYVATCVYGSYDCPEVWTLRRYRDYELSETWYGRLFIKIYYFFSPTIVKIFGNTEWFKNMWKPKLDRIVEALQKKGYKDTPYKDKQW